MFKCPKCKGDLVYEWLLGKVMCLNPTCGFDTTWEEAMEHCQIGSGKGFEYCKTCKKETWCTVSDDSIICDTCLFEWSPKHKFVIEIHDLSGDDVGHDGKN